MTAQTPDRLLFNGYEFHIVEDSETMFDPITHGFQPVSPHTACWRGYILHFAIANRQLFLRTLEVNQKAPPDVWHGVVPKSGTFARMPLWVLYEEVNLSIEFTGRIVIARKFIDDYYVHLGFQTWYGYQDVWLLEFQEGLLLYQRNLSPQALIIRDEIAPEIWSTSHRRALELFRHDN